MIYMLVFPIFPINAYANLPYQPSRLHLAVSWIAQAPSAKIPGDHRYDIRKRAIRLMRSWDDFIELNSSRMNWTILSIKYPYQLQYVSKNQGTSNFHLAW